MEGEYEKFEKMEFLNDDPHMKARHVSQYQAERTEVLKLIFHDRYQEAFKLCCKLYEKELEFFGPFDLDLLDTKANLAGILKHVDRREDALKLLNELVDTWTTRNGPKDNKTLQSLSSKGRILREMKRFDEALEVFTQVYEIEKDDKFRVREKLETLGHLVDIYEEDLKDIEKAIYFLEIRYAIQKKSKFLGKNDHETGEMKERLDRLKNPTGDKEEVKDAQQEVKDLQDEVEDVQASVSESQPPSNGTE